MLKTQYEAEAARTEIGLGQFVHPTRLALTGKSVGPGLFELAELLGRDSCLARLRRAREYVASLPAQTP